MAKHIPGLRETKNGRWQIRYYDDKTHERLSENFERKSDAIARLGDVKTDKRRGVWVDPRKAKTRLSDLAQQWLESPRDRDPQPRQSTLQREEIGVRLYVKPYFGRIEVGDIDYDAVKGFLGHLKACGLAPATQTKYLNILKRILDEALKSKSIQYNPVSLLNGPGTEATRTARFLEADEVNALADAINGRYRAMILLSGYRGLRWGELAGLKVERLNLLQSKLEVVEVLTELGSGFSFGPPKTKDGVRPVKLPAFLVEELSRHQEHFPPQQGMVFTSERGSFLARSSFARAIWAPAVAKAGLEPGVTFHSLRHSATSMLIASGAKLSEVREILGWSQKSANAMQARYGHLLKDRDDKLAQATEDAYQEAVQRQKAIEAGKIAPLKRQSGE